MLGFDFKNRIKNFPLEKNPTVCIFNLKLSLDLSTLSNIFLSDFNFVKL
jgi:hypothetical protein